MAYADPVAGRLRENEQVAAVADIVTDMSLDANDNELKGKINELLAALRAAGYMAS